MNALRTAMTEQPHSLHATAALRIGYGFLYLAFLLREFPHRDEIWGPGSPWTPALASELFNQTGWSSILTLSDSRPYFEVCYLLAVVTSALFLLGWRTRVVSVVFAVVVASFHARSIFMTDGGDNLILLMAFYLCFTACGRRWSLDARRAGKRGTLKAVAVPARRPVPGWLRDLDLARRQLATVLHNCALFVIAAQVCLLYGSAGLYKVQGSLWGNGTAIHYVLNLDLFRPWPTLSVLVDRLPMLIAVASYLTVLLQVAFPFVLFSRVKYVVLPLLIGMHVGIAVLMGLPLFSGAMVVADAVFLPDRFYGFLGRGLSRTFRRADPVAAPTADAPSTPVPRQPRPEDSHPEHRPGKPVLALEGADEHP
ncbi:HTTM domain-containing protein [Streptomyces brevispora]|uniref:HTTM domain-containing protein n=2 Tax=Streptomyces brevispora TaxID=887462 RepID=A0ABZ1GEJ8_9ACTN|nr:HTTM domain-containing protein [Streptomyces brevispora]WSC11515.1 HTTM domain-containing protein [Streptomyces brevispora]WSC17596.1 HTTM domain-containing protein [Streptomyces brevispora]